MKAGVLALALMLAISFNARSQTSVNAALQGNWCVENDAFDVINARNILEISVSCIYVYGDTLKLREGNILNAKEREFTFKADAQNINLTTEFGDKYVMRYLLQKQGDENILKIRLADGSAAKYTRRRDTKAQDAQKTRAPRNAVDLDSIFGGGVGGLKSGGNAGVGRKGVVGYGSNYGSGDGGGGGGVDDLMGGLMGSGSTGRRGAGSIGYGPDVSATTSASTGATIFIATLPPKADIYVGEKFVGVSNSGELPFPIGTHQVKFVKDGIEKTEKMTISPGKNQTRFVNLK
jgi:transcriptional antiterminator Rof (Rho-off)